MKRLKTTLCLLASIIICIACKKDDRHTKATQTGANTFSCLINGKLFMPKQALFAPEPLYATFNSNEKSLYIRAINPNDNNKHIYIYINNIYKGVGLYNLDNNISLEKGNKSYIELSLDNPTTSYYQTELGIGNVNITRSDRNVVSGTFEFVAQNVDDASDKVTCTKGRFDLIVNGIK